jgi:hypothetical protein
MSHENTFANVSRFLNPQRGDLLAGRRVAHGVRIRKNFPTKEPRLPPRKPALEMKAMQVTSGIRPRPRFSTDDQFHEAEAAFRRLAGKPHPLAFYLDFALANYREPVTKNC